MQTLALNLIRFACAGSLLIHGITRFAGGGVNPFDSYLSGFGFPPFTAWVITAFEIVGSIMIMVSKWVTPIAIAFTIELAMGIFLLHRHEGWFVVGGGRNGMEYSVLLIVCFSATALAWRKKG
jgi:putative oxidoreductase